MKTHLILFVFLLVVISLSLPAHAGDPSIGNPWIASDCSCSPNVSREVFGYYDLPAKPGKADEAEFLNFSLLTRIGYLYKTVTPNGELIDLRKADALKQNMALARRFNTKVDLAIKLSAEFKEFAIPEEDYAPLAKASMKLLRAFEQEQKRLFNAKKEELINEFATTHFVKEFEQINEKIKQLGSNLVTEDEINEELTQLNNKLNKSMELILNIEKTAKLFKTEKEKQLLKDQILEEMRLEKNGEGSQKKLSGDLK